MAHRQCRSPATDCKTFIRHQQRECGRENASSFAAFRTQVDVKLTANVPREVTPSNAFFSCSFHPTTTLCLTAAARAFVREQFLAQKFTRRFAKTAAFEIVCMLPGRKLASNYYELLSHGGRAPSRITPSGRSRAIPLADCVARIPFNRLDEGPLRQAASQAVSRLLTTPRRACAMAHCAVQNSRPILSLGPHGMVHWWRSCPRYRTAGRGVAGYM